jgi:hypothetical protein
LVEGCVEGKSSLDRVAIRIAADSAALHLDTQLYCRTTSNVPPSFAEQLKAE